MGTEERFRTEGREPLPDQSLRRLHEEVEAWTARLRDPLLWALATTTERRATLAMIRGWRWI
jgi:hypothetical protein